MPVKTWRDFSVEPIQSVWARAREHPVPEEEWDRIFAVLTADSALSVTVPCRTCGVRRPLSALDHVCQPEDRWLWEFVQGHPGAVDAYRPYVSRLRQRYPLQAAHAHLYRGLHFLTEDAFWRFAETLRDDVYDSPRLSSWTTDAQQAERFARFLPAASDASPWREAVRQMVHDQADMMGPFGVVLSLTAHPAHVLCDVVQADPGAFRESAVILLPGRYRVTLAGWYVRRAGATVWDLTDPAWAAIMADSCTGETP